MIDWNKVSEFALQGFITLVIGLILAYAGYRYGKRQSDSSWQRELASREKQQSEQMGLLQNQLDEQSKQRELAERKRSEDRDPGPIDWNIGRD